MKKSVLVILVVGLLGYWVIGLYGCAGVSKKETTSKEEALLEPQSTLKFNDIGRVEIITHRTICYDYYTQNKQTGSFILIDSFTNATIASGMILQKSPTLKSKKIIGADPVSRNITRERTDVEPETRKYLFGHDSVTIWMTGLSGSGKSTIARALENKLVQIGFAAFTLDGDNIRHGLNKDLGFSNEDRTENIRRISEVAKLMNDAGLITITSFISPFLNDRKLAKKIIGNNRFVEVFVKADINTCRKRDPKGLYKKADAGQIKEFTGIDSSYDIPVNPDILINTEKVDVVEAVKKIIDYLIGTKNIQNSRNCRK